MPALLHTSTRLLRLALPAVLAGLLLAAPAAHAEEIVIHHYDVTIRGEGEQTAEYTGPSTCGPWTGDSQARYRWTTRQRAYVIDGELFMTPGPTTTADLLSASSEVSVPNCVTGGVTRRGCRGTGWMQGGEPQGSLLVTLPARPDGNPGVAFELEGWRGGIAAMTDCFGGDPSRSMSVASPGVDPLTMIDPDELASNGFTKAAGWATNGEDCPLRNENTVACDARWSAVVEFRYREREVVGEDEQPGSQPGPRPDGSGGPTPPAPPRPGGGPTGTGGGPGGRPSTPVPPRRDAAQVGGSRVGPGARSAEVRVRCASGCSVSAEAVARQRSRGGRRGARAAQAARVLARARVTVAAGREGVVRLRFRPAAARAVRRAGGVTVRLRITPRDGGAPVRRDVVVRTRG